MSVEKDSAAVDEVPEAGETEGVVDEARVATEVGKVLAGLGRARVRVMAATVVEVAAMVMGPAVMERITDGQYDWRDAGFKRPRHR